MSWISLPIGDQLSFNGIGFHQLFEDHYDSLASCLYERSLRRTAGLRLALQKKIAGHTDGIGVNFRFQSQYTMVVQMCPCSSDLNLGHHYLLSVCVCMRNALEGTSAICIG